MTEPKPWLREIEVEIEPEKVIERTSAALEGLLTEAAIPGFRKGRIPRHIIETRYGKEIESQAASDLIREAYETAIAEKRLRPLKAGTVEHFELTPDKHLRFRISLEVMPDFELKPYVGIPLRRNEPTGFDDEFERRLNALRERLATFTPLNRPSENGDYLSADYITTDEQGKEIDRKTNIMLLVGDAKNFPQLNEQLLGLLPGDERDISVKVPDDLSEKQFAGKTLNYHIGVRGVKAKRLPDLDDELAVNLGFTDLNELREHLNQEILNDRKEMIERDLLDQVHNWIIREHEFEPPPSLTDEVYAQLLARLEAKETPELKERLLPIAQRQARFQAVVARIAQAENIEVSDEERDRVLEDFVQQTKTNNADIERLRTSESFRYRLLEEKVMKFLRDKASVQNPPAEVKEAVAATPEQEGAKQC